MAIVPLARSVSLRRRERDDRLDDPAIVGGDEAVADTGVDLHPAALPLYDAEQPVHLGIDGERLVDGTDGAVVFGAEGDAAADVDQQRRRRLELRLPSSGTAKVDADDRVHRRPQAPPLEVDDR